MARGSRSSKKEPGTKSMKRSNLLNCFAFFIFFHFFQASEQDVEMIQSFGGKPGKTKTSEKLPSLISTLMEEEKVIKEKYKMLSLAENVPNENVFNEKVSNEKLTKEKYEMLTLAKNVSYEKCDESKTEEMEEVNLETIDSLQVDEVSKQYSENEMYEGPKKDSVMETKIQELYSLLLQNGDEGRIENFQKFVLNQQSC